MTGSWWQDNAISWQSGEWSIELRGDELAEIRYHGRQVLRGVRAAVRDRGWLTVPVHVDERSFDDTSLHLRLRHEGLGALLTSSLSAKVEGTALRIAWEADNQVLFDTNRTGLVALHPASAAGEPVTVVHDDGSIEQTAFPHDISPHQPIMDIRELRIGDDGATMTVKFEGDVFEMEDQRNWTDASFKTYSRPLALPFPYALPSGERVQQSITIHVDGDASSAPAPSGLLILQEAGVFPEIGVESSTAPDPGPSCSDGGFRVVELNLTTLSWPAALARAAADALPLDVRLVTDGKPAPLAAVAAALAVLDVRRVAPFDVMLHVSDTATVTATRAALAAAGVTASLIGGARSHFTELNRERHRLPDDLDGVTFTTTPLSHTLDTEQLIEAVAMQRLLALQSVQKAGGQPVHIGPVALRPRFNNVATTPEPAPTRRDLSEGYGAEFTGAADHRQRAPELAGWTIASAAALAVPGVESLSWFETWGPRGIRDLQGMAGPAAEAIDALAPLVGGTLLWSASPDGLIWALGARSNTEDTILVANLDRVSRIVQLQCGAVGAPHERQLSSGSWSQLVLPH